MEKEEAEAFEQYPLFDLIIQMRKWDELAKIENRPVPNLKHFEDLIFQHLSAQN